MLKKMTIGRKLSLCFSVVLLLAMGQSYFSLSSTNSLDKDLQTETQMTSKKLRLAGEMATYAFEMRAAQRGLVMYSLMTDSEQVNKSKALFLEGETGMRKTIAEIRPLLVKPVARKAVETAEEELNTWLPLYQKILQSCSSQRFDPTFKELLVETGTVNDRIEEAAGQIIQAQLESEAETAQNAEREMSGIRWILSILVAMFVVIGSAVIWVVRNLSATLRKMVIGLSESSIQVASASTQIASTSQNLSQGSSEQAASLEEVSASMEEMTAMTRRNAENSSAATSMMEETVSHVDRSNGALQEMVASMGAIKTSSEKVARINKTIDEIAFQTNILALNAAVEAARAGEAGMGFAVVADEVRNLAQRSAAAAKDTAELIEEAISNSNQGAVKLEQVASAIRRITDSAGRVKGLVTEVNEASKQQTTGIGQVATAVTQVSAVTQTAAASAEESAAAAQELSAQSQSVAELVRQLEAMVESDPSGGDNCAHAAVSRKAGTVRTGSVAAGSTAGGGFKSF